MTQPNATTVEVLRKSAKVAVALGILLMLGIGGIALYGAFSGENSRGISIVGGIIGGLFALLALAMICRIPRVFARHTFTFDSWGVRYVVGRGPGSFAVAWTDLRTVTVSVGHKQTRAGETILVRLDLLPVVDLDSFLAVHQDMKRMRRPSAPILRLPLGPNRYLIDELAAALAQHAGPRFGGVHDERASGLTYV